MVASGSPPPSPPKLAVEDLPAERPIFGRFFAIVRAALASLRIGLVSYTGFGAPVSDDKNPVPGGSLGGSVGAALHLPCRGGISGQFKGYRDREPELPPQQASADERLGAAICRRSFELHSMRHSS